jgi:hypothetical protein
MSLSGLVQPVKVLQIARKPRIPRIFLIRDETVVARIPFNGNAAVEKVPLPCPSLLHFGLRDGDGFRLTVNLRRNRMGCERH